MEMSGRTLSESRSNSASAKGRDVVEGPALELAAKIGESFLAPGWFCPPRRRRKSSKDRATRMAWPSRRRSRCVDEVTLIIAVGEEREGAWWRIAHGFPVTKIGCGNNTGGNSRGFGAPARGRSFCREGQLHSRSCLRAEQRAGRPVWVESGRGFSPQLSAHIVINCHRPADDVRCDSAGSVADRCGPTGWDVLLQDRTAHAEAAGPRSMVYRGNKPG